MGALAPILSFGFKAFSAISAFSQQNNAADAQAQQQAEITRQRQETLRLQQQQSRLTQQQEQEKLAKQAFRVDQDSKKATGQARAAAATAGVAGVSVDSLVQDLNFQRTLFDEDIDREGELLAQRAELQSRSNSQSFNADFVRINSPIQRPSFAGTAVRIGQSALSLFG